VKTASRWVVDAPERETAMSGTGSGVTRFRWRMLHGAEGIEFVVAQPPRR
jgi:hypothetical protein